MVSEEKKTESIAKSVVARLSRIRQGSDFSEEKTAAGQGASEDALTAKIAIASMLEKQGVDFSPDLDGDINWKKFFSAYRNWIPTYTELTDAFDFSDHFIRVKTAESPLQAIPIGADGISRNASIFNRYIINLEPSSNARIVHGCMGAGQSAEGSIDLVHIELGAGAKLDLTMFARSNRDAPMFRIITVAGGRRSRCRINEGYDLAGPTRQVVLAGGGGLGLSVSSLLLGSRISIIGAHFSYEVTGGARLKNSEVFIKDPNGKIEVEGLAVSNNVALADKLLEKLPAEYAVELRANI